MTKQHTTVAAAFASTRTTTDIAGFLEDLLTPAELEKIEKRWKAILMLLNSDRTQVEVAESIGCALAIVSRANRVIEHGTGIAVRIAHRQNRMENRPKNA